MAFLQTALIKSPLFPDAELPKQFYAQQGYRFMHLPQAEFLLLKSSSLWLFGFFEKPAQYLTFKKKKLCRKFDWKTSLGVCLPLRQKFNFEICKVKPKETFTIKANAFLQWKQSTKPTSSCCSGSCWNKERAVLNMISAAAGPLINSLLSCCWATKCQDVQEWFTTGSELLFLRKTKQILTKHLVASGNFCSKNSWI